MFSSLSRFKREHGIPLETLLWKRASSCVEGRILWFFLNCGGKLGVPLELRPGPQGPARVALEKSGLFLVARGTSGFLSSLPENRSMSRVQLVDLVFLSGSDRDLGLPIKLHLESQALSRLRPRTLLNSRVVKGVSGLLSSSCRELGLLQEDQQGSQASHHAVRGSSVFHGSQCRGIRTYLELRGNLVSFFLAAGSAGFHLRFNR